jgi:hypothetical protein
MQTPRLSTGSLTSLSPETSDCSDSAEETDWTPRSQWSLYNAGFMPETLPAKKSEGPVCNGGSKNIELCHPSSENISEPHNYNPKLSMAMLEKAAHAQLGSNQIGENHQQAPQGQNRLPSSHNECAGTTNDTTDGASHDLLVLLADNEAASALIISLKRSAEILNAEKSLLVRQRDDARDRIGSLQDHILDLQKDIDALISERETLESDKEALKKELAIQRDLFSDLEQVSLTNIAQMLREKAGRGQLPEQVEHDVQKVDLTKAITAADSEWIRKIKEMEIEYKQQIATMERMVAMTRAEESTIIMRAKKRCGLFIDYL